MAETKRLETSPAGPVASESNSAEVTRLKARVAELEAQLAEAKGTPNTRPTPAEPSYGLSEGQRVDLAQTGKAVSPFTGALQVGDGEPGSKPREVDSDEFAKAKRPE